MTSLLTGARGVALLRAVVTALCVWLGLLAWRGFGEQPGRFTSSVLALALVVALVGWGVRLVRPIRWLAPVAQLLLISWWLMYAAGGSALPRRTTLARAWDTIVAGIGVAQTQPTPVPAIYPEFTTMLIAAALVVVVIADLLSCGLDRPALVGLPLLLVVAFAASIYLQPVSALALLLAGLVWLALIGLTDHALTGLLQTASTWRATGRIALGAGLVALALPLIVPATHLPGSGDGDGGGAQGTRLINPVLNLKRDLTQGPDLDLVTARTTADPTYLRLSVLDEFTGSVWRPSEREMGSDLSLDGPLPGAEGLTDRVRTTQTGWSVQVSKQFQTTWLPLPYPATRVADVRGQWRFDPSTLDVTSADGRTAAGQAYRLNALQVSPTKAQLSSAPFLTGPIVERMTALPRGMPPVFGDTARRVTRGSKSNYERAVRLQRWFRERGGFTYSTAAQPGTGMSTLANFISINRVGYCEQYAAAMAVLARELRIPARVVVGFLSPERTGDLAVYSTRDLHAWPELFFAGVGWVRFEPTPGVRAATVPGYTRGTLRPDADQPVPSPSESVAPAPDVPLPEVRPRPTPDAAATHTWSMWWWGVIAGGLALAAPRLVRSILRRRRLAAPEPALLAEGLWTELRDSAIDARLTWTDGRSPRRVEQDLRTASALADPEATQALAGVIDFIDRQRYDVARVLSDSDREQVVGRLLTWERALTELDRSPRAVWWPRSVWRVGRGQRRSVEGRPGKAQPTRTAQASTRETQSSSVRK